MPNAVEGWTSITTRVLSEGGPRAYDVIDDAVVVVGGCDGDGDGDNREEDEEQDGDSDCDCRCCDCVEEGEQPAGMGGDGANTRDGFDERCDRRRLRRRRRRRRRRGCSRSCNTFVERLNRELESTGLLGKLRPAKTVGENRVDDVLRLLLQNPVSRDAVARSSAAGGGGSSDNASAAIAETLSQLLGQQQQQDDEGYDTTAKATTTGVSAATRGDKSVFVGRATKNSPDFASRYPCLNRIVTAVEETATAELSLPSSCLKCRLRRPRQQLFEFDLSLTSVQVAEYPGDGISGYPRHCDRDGNLCRHEGNEQQPKNGVDSDNTKQGGSRNQADEEPMKRIVTAVYYATPDDWDADLDAGCLRLFAALPGNRVGGGARGGSSVVDVVPYRNRLVVFRSDAVEHQVLPSKRRPRRAITIWLYGRKIRNAGNGDRGGVGPQTDPPAAKAGGISTSSVSGPPPLSVIGNEGVSSTAEQQGTIFVSIAAYRDSETGPTIRHLMDTALHPDQIFVGLLLQIDTSSNSDEYDDKQVVAQLPTEEPWYASRVRCLTLDARHATGPCPARALCQSLYRGEEYVLQIDSHMRFRRNWDAYLIEQLKLCPNPKSMLTAYPVGYSLPNNIPNETRGTYLHAWKFGTDGMLRQRGRFFADKPSRPVLCSLFAAGFNFSRGDVIEDCPYDGRLHHLFFGEESSMALRLYKAGYDLYAPPESVCYHLWSRSHRPTPMKAPWANTNEISRQREKSKQIVQEQLLPRKTLSSNNFVDERTVSDFGAAIGVDFAARVVMSTGSNILDDEDAALPPEVT